MALQSIKGVMAFPSTPLGNVLGNAPGLANIMSVDSTNDYAALICRAPKTGTIVGLGFVVENVVGASGNVVIDCRLETVDLTTGNPSGTLFAANTNGSKTVNFDDDNKYLEATLTASASVTQGDYMCAVFNPTSFTTVTSCAIRGLGTNDFSDPHTYGASNSNAAGWVKSSTTTIATFIYSGTVYEPVSGVIPAVTITATAFNSGSSPSKRALKFQVPFKCRAVGAWVWLAFSADCDIKLYDSNGTTVLASKSLDKDATQSTSAAVFFCKFTDNVTLTANTNYYISVEPTSVTNITVYHWTNAQGGNAVLDASPGGKLCILSTNAGSWSDSSDSQMLAGVLIDQLDDGAGGGGATAFAHIG